MNHSEVLWSVKACLQPKSHVTYSPSHRVHNTRVYHHIVLEWFCMVLSLLSNCAYNVPLLGNLLHLGGGISIFLNTPLWNGLHSITAHSWLFFHFNGLLQTLPWRVSLLCWSPLCWRGAVVSGTFSGWSILSARSMCAIHLSEFTLSHYSNSSPWASLSKQSRHFIRCALNLGIHIKLFTGH